MKVYLLSSFQRKDKTEEWRHTQDIEVFSSKKKAMKALEYVIYNSRGIEPSVRNTKDSYVVDYISEGVNRWSKDAVRFERTVSVTPTVVNKNNY